MCHVLKINQTFENIVDQTSVASIPAETGNVMVKSVFIQFNNSKVSDID